MGLGKEEDEGDRWGRMEWGDEIPDDA